MKTLPALLLALFFHFCAMAQVQVNATDQDREIVKSILSQLESRKQESTAQLIALAGKQLLGTPYEASTLEGESEELVVNLRGLDCTTFAEYCLALARTTKSSSPDFETFAGELQKIRYRNGKIDGYPSRLHYFSDWIWDNRQKGLVQIDTGEWGGEPCPLNIDFMSKHPGSYPQLKTQPEFVEEMQKIEATIRARKMYFIPREKVSEMEDRLKTGDIVGITTSIAGLDMSHVGILVSVDGRIHLLHASSSAKKVVLSEETLEEYLLKGSKTTGIMVARPL